MTILESILAYMAGEAQSLPATTNTEEERLMKKIAQRLDAGLLPVIGDSDSGKVLTVSNELAAEWAEIPSDNT